MKKCLLAKFEQNYDLKIKLLGTGDAILIESSPRDEYWGSGKYNMGKNKLGRLLMEVRDSLLSEKYNRFSNHHVEKT